MASSLGKNWLWVLLGALAAVGLAGWVISQVPAGGVILLTLLIIFWIGIAIGYWWPNAPSWINAVSRGVITHDQGSGITSGFLLVASIFAIYLATDNEDIRPTAASVPSSQPTLSQSQADTESKSNPLCVEAISRIKALCPQVDSPKIWDCSTPKRSITGQIFTDLKGISIVQYRNMLEWVVTNDGHWYATNGMTQTWCLNEVDVGVLIRKQLYTSAPVRGVDARSYEGLYNKEGNHKHKECSRYEFEIADKSFRISARHPGISDKKLYRLYKKATGLPGKIVWGIETKASMNCGWVFSEDIISNNTP